MSNHTATFYLGGVITDTNQDLHKVKLPSPSGITVIEVSVNVLRDTTGTATVELRDDADGAGSAISITIAQGVYYGETTGASLSGATSGYFYFRVITPAGMDGVNITIGYTR